MCTSECAASQQPPEWVGSYGHSLLEGSQFTNLLSCFTVVVPSYTDSNMSVTLSIWNIIVLLNFKLSVKQQ